MKRDLMWYLLRENKDDKKEEKPKETPKPVEKSDSKKIGKPLLPSGKMGQDLAILIKEIRKEYNTSVSSTSLSSYNGSKLLKKLNLKSNLDKSQWTKVLKDIKDATSISEIFLDSKAVDDSLLKIQLAPNWRSIGVKKEDSKNQDKDENMSRRFIGFWITEILVAIGHDRNREAGLALKDFDHRLEGNNVYIVQTKKS